MDRCEKFLSQTECHFNWRLSELDVNNHLGSMVVKLKDKIEEKETTIDATEDNKLTLKLTFGFELFTEDAAEAEKCVDEVIRLILGSKDDLIVKYCQSYLHVAYSTKAFMLLKKDQRRLKEIEQLIGKIKPVSELSDVEMSGLLAAKVKIFRYYGPDGTNKSLSWMRQAVKLNPNQFDWKIALVVTLNRKRHFFKGCEVKWKDVEESVNILEELLCWPELTSAQTAMCNYYLAVALHDYVMGKKPDHQVIATRQKILRLCKGFYNETNHPQYVTFAAERFCQSREAKDNQKGMQIIEKYLDKYPNHIGVNTTASKIMKNKQNFSRALQYAQIAMDNGGYGAAWIWLECKIKLREEINDEEFFDKMLSLYQDMYKKSIHLNASIHYFYLKKDPVNGAYHMEQALLEDPNFDQLWKPLYCYHVEIKVVPIEVAYNQIVLALQTHKSHDDQLILKSAKLKIEQVRNVQGFPMSRDVVEEAFNNFRRKQEQRKTYGGRR